MDKIGHDRCFHVRESSGEAFGLRILSKFCVADQAKFG